MTYPFLHIFEASRYSPAYLRQGVPESVVQAACVARLRALGAAVDIRDTGAAKLRGRAYGALKRRGVKDPRALLKGFTGAGSVGASDLVFTLPGGRAGFLEVKAPGRWVEGARGRLVQDDGPGQPTPEQLEYLERRRLLGAVVGVAWAALDVDVILSGVA